MNELNNEHKNNKILIINNDKKNYIIKGRKFEIIFFIIKIIL